MTLHDTDLHDLGHFTSLTSSLMLHMIEKDDAPQWWLRIMLAEQRVEEEDEALLLDVLAYLQEAYRGRRRITRAPAVLHPLRAAALLILARGEAHLLDMLTVLLHDKREDLPGDGTIEEAFQALLRRLDPLDEWYLMERLGWLTREPNQSYFVYTAQLLDHAQDTPEVVRVKLADRLDNLLDLRLDDYEQLPLSRFHEILFRTLSDPSYTGFRPRFPHRVKRPPINGAERMYQLFKSAAVLSLIREKHIELDAPAQRLFDAISRAGASEGMRIMLHVFGYHWESGTARQRRLVLETMEYAQAGGLERVSAPTRTEPLDGLVVRYFDMGDKKRRKRRLAVLYKNKELLARAALAFVLIFRRFGEDPDFHLDGLVASAT